MQKIDIDLITLPQSRNAGNPQIMDIDRIRSSDDDHIADLAKSIEKNGLLHPITVRKIGNQYELIAGYHRWQAVKSLGETVIKAEVLHISEDQARLLEVEENIFRKNFSAFETMKAYTEFKTRYEKLYPDTAHGATGISRGKKSDQPNYADYLAKRNHKHTPRHIQRLVQQYNRLSPATRDKITGTELSGNGKWLAALAEVPESNQPKVAQHFLDARKDGRKEIGSIEQAQADLFSDTEENPAVKAQKAEAEAKARNKTSHNYGGFETEEEFCDKIFEAILSLETGLQFQLLERIIDSGDWLHQFTHERGYRHPSKYKPLLKAMQAEGLCSDNGGIITTAIDKDRYKLIVAWAKEFQIKNVITPEAIIENFYMLHGRAEYVLSKLTEDGHIVPLEQDADLEGAVLSAGENSEYIEVDRCGSMLRKIYDAMIENFEGRALDLDDIKSEAKEKFGISGETLSAFVKIANVLGEYYQDADSNYQFCFYPHELKGKEFEKLYEEVENFAAENKFKSSVLTSGRNLDIAVVQAILDRMIASHNIEYDKKQDIYIGHRAADDDPIATEYVADSDEQAAAEEAA